MSWARSITSVNLSFLDSQAGIKQHSPQRVIVRVWHWPHTCQLWFSALYYCSSTWRLCVSLSWRLLLFLLLLLRLPVSQTSCSLFDMLGQPARPGWGRAEMPSAFCLDQEENSFQGRATHVCTFLPSGKVWKKGLRGGRRGAAQRGGGWAVRAALGG